MNFAPRFFIVALLIQGLVLTAHAQAPSSSALEGSLNRTIEATSVYRNASWDWTDGSTSYTLYRQGQSGIVSHPGVKVPFYSGSGPAADDFNTGNDATRDMHPDEGWRLLLRDFGTASSAPTYPYFILYNKYRGTLRIFYYNQRFVGDYSYSLVTLGHSDGSQSTTSGLTFATEDSTYMDNYDPDFAQSFVGEFSSGWNYADFNMAAYDQNVPTDAIYRFRIIGVSESDVDLSGSIEALIEQQANLGGRSGSPQDWISKGVKNFRSVSKGVDWLEEQANASDSWYSGALESLLSSPIGDLAKVAAPMGAFVGVLRGLVSSNKPSYPMQFTFRGSLDISGTITQSSTTEDLLMRVPGAQHSGSSPPVPLYDKPLGLIGIATRPSLNLDEYSYTRYLLCGRFVTFVESRTYTAPDGIDYVVNPHADITVDSLDASLVPQEDFPVGYVDVDNLSGQSYTQTHSPTCYDPSPPSLEVRIGLRMRYRPANASNFSELTLLKLYDPTPGGDFGAPTGTAGATVANTVLSPDAPAPDVTFSVEAAYPNPTSRSVAVPIEVPVAARASVEVFDLLGRRVTTLANRSFQPGRHEIRWNDAASQASGTYMIRVELRADSGQTYTDTQKVVVLE